MKILDRIVLTVIRLRLRGDADNTFMGRLMLAIAHRVHQRGKEADAQKALNATITEVTMQVMALDKFVNLDAAESLRH